MSLSKTIDVVNQADNVLEVSLSQAAHMAWLQQATAKDESRPTLEHVKVSQDGDEALAADGFRIHAIHMVRPAKVLLDLAGRLVRFGQRILRRSKQTVPYTLAEETVKFPSLKESNVSLLLAVKPLAVFAIDPKFVREALQDTTGVVLMKVYANGTDGSLVEFFAYEDGVSRYALVMGMDTRQSLIDHLSWRPEELNP